MVQKIPPPPPIASNTPEFNRWLLELTAILNASGGIDPSSVTGLTALQTQVATNTSNIATLEGASGGQGGEIATLQGQMNGVLNSITTINSEITTLNANPIVRNGTGAPNSGLGNIGDWYGNLTGAAGARVYIKTGTSTWTAFPF